MKNGIDFFAKKPSLLFLLDGLGAALTSFSLFFVLRQYQAYFGMPAQTLVYLSALALLYCVFSLTCFLFLSHNRAVYLKIIAWANGLYCLATMLLLLVHYEAITPLGFTYFLGEMLIIGFLARLEFRVATIIVSQL